MTKPELFLFTTRQLLEHCKEFVDTVHLRSKSLRLKQCEILLLQLQRQIEYFKSRQVTDEIAQLKAKARKTVIGNEQ
jgi:hypothetical protein